MRAVTRTVLTAGMAAANTIAIGMSAQRISVALPDTDAGGQSLSGLPNLTMETIIAANTAAALAAHSQTVISTPFTGRTPPSG